MLKQWQINHTWVGNAEFSLAQGSAVVTIATHLGVGQQQSPPVVIGNDTRPRFGKYIVLSIAMNIPDLLTLAGVLSICARTSAVAPSANKPMKLLLITESTIVTTASLMCSAPAVRNTQRSESPHG